MGPTTPDLASEEAIIVRYNSDGTLDQSFGTGGIARHSFGTTSAHYTPQSAALQPDGKILLSSSTLNMDSNLDFTLLRLKTDGGLDSTFGTGGKVRTGYLRYHDISADLALQPDNKIVAVGMSGTSTSFSQLYMLTRYLPNGNLDSSFGTYGIVDSIFVNTRVEHVAIPPSGKILVSGQYGVVLYRFNANGSRDTSWSTVVNSANAHPVANTLIQTMITTNDGSIFLGVDSGIYSYTHTIRIIKIQPNGQLDNTFGGSGYTSLSLNKASIIRDLKVQADNKILALLFTLYYDTSIAGFSYSKGTIAIARFLPDGQIDSQFGVNGIFSLDTISGAVQNTTSITLQADGKIIGLGSSSTSQYGPVVLRLLNTLTTGIIDFSSTEQAPLIYPNPIQSTATLQYELSNDEVISINLYDMQGRLVQNIATDKQVNQGKHSESIQIDDNVPRGNYLLRIDNGKGASSIKVTLK